MVAPAFYTPTKLDCTVDLSVSRALHMKPVSKRKDPATEPTNQHDPAEAITATTTSKKKNPKLNDKK